MLKTRRSFEGVKILLLLILAKVLCDYTYESFISISYSYQNFTINKTTSSQMTSWIIFILLSPLIIKNFAKEDICSRVLSLLTLVSFIPTMSMINHNADYACKFIILISVYWFLLHSLNILLPNYSIADLGIKKGRRFWLNVIILSIVFSVVYISGKFTGFRLFLDIVNVYDIRAQAQGYKIPILFAYLSLMADNVLPILLVFYLERKSRLAACCLIFLMILNFSIHAAKSVFFLLVVAILSVAVNKMFSKSYYNLIWFVILFGFTFVEFMLFGTSFSTLFFSYRILFVPAKLHYVYYDFFNVNELDYFRQSLFKFFLSSPYEKGIGYMMAYHDTGDLTGRANNGLFSDAYSNFGTLGVLTFPLVLIFLLKLINGPTKDINTSFKIVVSIILTLTFLSLPFSTALLSSGFVLMLGLFYLLPQNEISK